MSEQILSFSAELAQSIVESADQFPVDFDLAWQWSGYSSKAKGLKALSLYFSEGEDFLTSGQKVSTDGRPSVETFLTADCFKELAMVSRSDQGKKNARQAQSAASRTSPLNPSVIRAGESSKAIPTPS